MTLIGWASLILGIGMVLLVGFLAVTAATMLP